MTQKLPVVELFGPTLQGEGALCGQVSYFVRLFGCQYRCSWCDSMRAVEKQKYKKAKLISPREITKRLVNLVPELPVKDKPWVTLTGGDPCLWNLHSLCAELWSNAFRIAVETQGAIFREWLVNCDLVTCSPKGPSSGMADKFNVAVIQQYIARLNGKLVFKIVAFDDADLDFAERIHAWQPKIPFYLSAGTPQDLLHPNIEELTSSILIQYRWLIESVLKRPVLHNATILPQVHALVWGSALGH